MTDSNKLAKYKERVYELLDKNRYCEDSQKKPTHLAYGLFQGKFILDNLQKKELLSLYSKAIKVGVKDFSILETQKEYGPVIVDIDLEALEESYPDSKRLYDENMIVNIINKYIEAINYYLNITKDTRKDTLKCFIFEKEKPTKKEDTLKDGFHIIFPETCVHSKIRYLIRSKVVKQCIDENILDGYLNSPEKIIDKAVVSTNGWFLYGSKKPNGQLYQLTKVYDYKLEMIYNHTDKKMINPNTGEETKEYYKNSTLIKFLSLQKEEYCKDYATILNLTDREIEDELSNNVNQNMSKDTFKYEISASQEDDIRRAVKFTSMLNDKRAMDYHDWLRVGLALHNINDILLPTWVEFSKKCSKKFKEGECEKIWKTMKNPTSGNVLTIRSLAFWAKQDDPKQYEVFNREEFKAMMRKSLDGNNYYIAKSVYSKYSDRFICSSIKSNVWWEFKNHRWIRIEEGYTLKVMLSEEFANEYNKEIAEISIKATVVSGIEKEELQQRRMRIDKIVEKLMNNAYKNTLMDECRSLFYDATFEQKLDSNIYLIGFENGVYDLEQSIFREGRPDDYITLSTKNDYYKWSDKNPTNKLFIKFFDQILPKKSVRDYFLNALCTCLSGETKEEKLYVLTGSGSNGKSLTMDLMYQSLGDYYMSCDISIITRKRGQSNQAAPEKVRMKGRRCGVFQEADDGEKLNVGIMKEFTGGDKVLIRDLFKGSTEMIEFKPQMKYFLTCNQLPEVPSNDDGTWRRIRVIEFGSKFCDNPTRPNEFLIDNTLKHKIEQWAQTFISYLIHIYNTEYKNKTYLTEPSEVIASTKQYKLENDHFTEFVIQCIEVTGNIKDTMGMKTLWDHFKTWFGDFYGGVKVPKSIDFNKFITKQFGEISKRGYVGIKIKIDECDSENESNKNVLDV
jgi:P4 family phage/plasmid primase-like protien